MIKFLGDINIPPQVIDNADKIKFEHYKVNSPAKFQVHTLSDTELMVSLSELIGVNKEKLDYVYFSVCGGAEEHTDLLDPNKFTNNTFVIPVILPNGVSTITAEGHKETVHIGGVYEFDHTKRHSMELEDISSGCVVIMVAVLI